MTTLYQIGGRLVRIGTGLGSGAAASGGGGDASNTMSLTNVSGSTVTDYPLSFGRAFAEGEIADTPSMQINGSSVTEGVDVERRWGDGSCQFAKVATVVGSLTNNVAKAITFVNNASPSNVALTKSEMLDARFDFDAVISITVGGVTHTASARTMLNADKYSVKRSNQVMTEVVICDHSGAYDMTWSSVPARPIFHARFWNALNKVEVSAICEQADAEHLGDLSISTLTITKGSASPTTAYTKSSFTMYLGTRWIRRFWIGTAPETLIQCDHNLSYLKGTLCGIANYDTTLLDTQESRLADFYNSYWTLKSRDLYDSGPWHQDMAATGARPDIAPMPTWSLFWLRTGDYRMRDIALSAADQWGWATFFRESATGKRLRRSHSAGSSGLGLPISITDRKTTSILNHNFDYEATVTGDKLKVVGANDVGAWGLPELSHQPDGFTIPYLLTGDPFYLEQLQMLAATSAHYTNGAAGISAYYSRGPSGDYGGSSGQIRGWGWGLLHRCFAHFYSPDDDPMKLYFEDLIADAIAVFEGRLNVTNGDYFNTTLWNWQADDTDPVAPTRDASNVLHWAEKLDSVPDGHPDLGGTSLFMHNYVTVSLGILKEMGYATDALLEWFGTAIIGMINDSPNPFMVCDYQTATGDWPGAGPGDFYTTWQALFDATETHAAHDSILATNIAKTDLGTLNGPNLAGAYGILSTCSTSFLTGYTGGAAARAWAETYGYDVAPAQDKADYPDWIILPRT